MVFHFKFKGKEFIPQTLVFIYYIFATRCLRPLILKYERFKPSGWKDIGISIFKNKLSLFLKCKQVFFVTCYFIKNSNLINVSWTLKVFDLPLFNETH